MGKKHQNASRQNPGMSAWAHWSGFDLELEKKPSKWRGSLKGGLPLAVVSLGVAFFWVFPKSVDAGGVVAGCLTVLGLTLLLGVLVLDNKNRDPPP